MLILDPDRAFVARLAAGLVQAGYEVTTPAPSDRVPWPGRGAAPVVCMVGLSDGAARRALGEAHRAGAGVVAILDDEYVGSYRAALRLGAHAAVTRRQRPEHIERVVEAVTTGEVLLPSALLHALVLQRAEELPSSVRLDREDRRLLGLLALGWSVRDVALELHLSERSGHRAIASICERMGVPNKTVAVVRAAQLGLLDSSHFEASFRGVDAGPPMNGLDTPDRVASIAEKRRTSYN